MNTERSYKNLFLTILFLLVSLEIAFGLANEYIKIARERDQAQQELADVIAAYSSTTAALSASIEQLHNLNHQLLDAQEESASLSSRLADEQQVIDSMQAQIMAVSGTVGTLQRLSETDKELLKKYSRVYFLNENFIPKDLVMIPSEYLFEPQKEKQILRDVMPFFTDMITDAKDAGIDLQVISAYRSFGDQSQLKSTYKVTYGAGTANKFSADQGYSEHQLGTTIDFTTKTLGAKFTSFGSDKAYSWLTENAYKYGFVLSYPKNNTYYTFEPWHWRFVGKALALRLHNEGKFFYDMQQRDIDQYLIAIFDK